jgi:biogenesis of lysosome-related organelles complex 1 subunit 1
MFSDIIRERQENKSALEGVIQKQREVVKEHLGSASEALVDSVNETVSCIFLSQRMIEEETKKLHVEAQKFSKQAGQWLQLLDSFSEALKELGDVENWAKSMERDMDDVLQGVISVANAQSSMQKDVLEE